MFQIRDIEGTLGYVFKQESLLCEALTHRSFSQASEQGITKHNERLEFLGDAVLGLVISEGLVANFPASAEGELSKIKAGLISRATLAGAARRLALGQWLRLGRGEETSLGREKSSLLANAVEALIGAVYLDGGLESARGFIHRVLDVELANTSRGLDSSAGGDWKSRLQEWVHKHDGTSLQYQLVGESGPDHQKVFSMTVEFGGHIRGRGEGCTKKEAAQRAAEEAFSQVSLGESDII